MAAGMVGVSNIALVSVAERTSEFGLRKALGATPGRIIVMVVTESLVLTVTAGYLGLLAGWSVLAAVSAWAPENDIVRDPSVGVGTAIGALVALVVVGALASAVPAIRASRLDPIDALRDA